MCVRSGHKTGKSTGVGILGLHWVATKPRGRVILTAPSHRQVDGILWKEITRLYKRARWPLGGQMHQKPESGLQFRDGREIIGFSTIEPERMAGFSGPNTLFIVDEASGVPEPIFEAIEGNLAGGGRVIMISNPTQTSGRFYESFDAQATDWRQIHISSRECGEKAPLELGEGTGLATIEWCDARLVEWGEDDPRYQVRVLGNFPSQSDTAMIAIALVDEAQKRWSSAPPKEGKLCIGVDVARFGADESAIVWSRGNWASEPIVLTGFDNVEVAEEVVSVVKDHIRPGERASVRIDTTNNGGVADILRRVKDVSLSIQEIIYSESPTVDGYSRMRDQLWGSLRAWLKEGGAIPKDHKLRGDIIAPTFGYDVRNRIKVEGKDDMRRRIGRSTDRADALALAVFNCGDDTARKVFSDKYRDNSSRW